MIVLAGTMAVMVMQVSGSLPSGLEGRGRALGSGSRRSELGGESRRVGLLLELYTVFILAAWLVLVLMYHIV